jgi:hypothetical protein
VAYLQFTVVNTGDGVPVPSVQVANITNDMTIASVARKNSKKYPSRTPRPTNNHNTNNLHESVIIALLDLYSILCDFVNFELYDP